MKQTTTAGKSRKSHKSHKTAPSTVLAGRPSSLSLATMPPLTPPVELPSVDKSPKTDKGSAQDELSRDTGVPTEDPKKQWWLRPPDSKMRKRAEKIMVMRAAGHDDKSIAKRLKTTEGFIRQNVYIARKNGWLDDNDEPVDLEAELALNVERKVVRNISASLDGQMTNWQTHEMTIATAKGRGIFKNHDVVRGDGQQGLAVVAIKIVMPPIGEGDQNVVDGSVGGVPAYIEGEVTAAAEALDTPVSSSVIHPELKRVFAMFDGINVAIVGSATRDFSAAQDIDVLVPASFDVRDYFKRAGFTYLGGFDADGVHVRRCAHFSVDGVSKPVQVIQWSTVEVFEQYPHCVLLRDGTRLNEGVFFGK